MGGLGAVLGLFFQFGLRVLVGGGLFLGRDGFGVKKTHDWRMLVSVSMLQRSVSVEIDHDWICEI